MFKNEHQHNTKPGNLVNQTIKIFGPVYTAHHVYRNI